MDTSLQLLGVALVICLVNNVIHACIHYNSFINNFYTKLYTMPHNFDIEPALEDFRKVSRIKLFIAVFLFRNPSEIYSSEVNKVSHYVHN